MVLAAEVGASPGAGAELGARDGILGAVVGLEADDPTVPHVGAQEAAASAVVGGAAGANDLRLSGDGRHGRTSAMGASGGGGISGGHQIYRTSGIDDGSRGDALMANFALARYIRSAGDVVEG